MTSHIAAAVVACGFALVGVYAAEPKAPVQNMGAGYVLGSGDEISIWALECEEISQKPYRIDESGVVNLPMVGPVKAAGSTTAALEDVLKSKLSRFIRKPEVTVRINDFGSQRVSVMGAVNKAGVVMLQGRKTLMEALSAAGGLRTDAGSTIIITRRTDVASLRLANAKASETFATGEIAVEALLKGSNPELNIEVRSDDVITVPASANVYVMGEVAKQGGFPLGHQASISVMEALSLAGGLGRVAAPQHARLLRRTEGAHDRTEVAVDVQAILKGKAPDVRLRPDDILYVPFNKPKAVALRTIDAAVSAGTGIAIWRSSR